MHAAHVFCIPRAANIGLYKNRGLKMIIYCKPSLRLTHKYFSIIGAISINSTFMLFIFSFEALVLNTF